MGGELPLTRWFRRYAFALGVAAGWPVARWVDWHVLDVIRSPLRDVIVRVLSGFPGAQMAALKALDVTFDGVVVTFAVTLFAATLGLPLAWLARVLGRARVRGGRGDPIARGAAWTAAHPRLILALCAGPGAAFQAWAASWQLGMGHTWAPAVLTVAAAMALVQGRVVLAALSAVLAPLDASPPAATPALPPGQIRFDAVAVTRETRAAVGALAAVTLGTVAWLASIPVQRLFSDRHVFWAIGAYVLTAACAALLFQRASRIRVGLDGVYVGGSSRPRFFAYRDLDEVRDAAGDLELRRRGRLVLRLQLHGEDAARRAAIAARVSEGIARVAAVQREGATHVVLASSAASVARSARGGADYRAASVSREALWALVEGAAVDGAARTAAARALCREAAGEERARIRVAASRCADPQVRVALEELAEGDPAHAEPGGEMGPPSGARRAAS